MIDIALDRESDRALYQQIQDAIEAAVTSGSLSPGDRLPPVATFAKNVGVTQSTIRRALEGLTAAGIVESHVGRGTFVREPDAYSGYGPVDGSGGRLSHRSPAGRNPALTDAARRLRTGIARGMDALGPLVQRPGLIRFTEGVPDPDLVEDGLLPRLVETALGRGQRAFQEYGDPMGLFALRKALAERFTREGYPVTPDMILITSGSQQAVALLAQHALEQEMRVACETPCFMGIPNAFAAVGHWVETVRRDRLGPVPERLMHFGDGRSTLFYTCPVLHNPMGLDMDPGRRKTVMQWAREHNGLVVEDEIFYDLQFDGKPRCGALADGDAHHVVVIGSFSKSFMTGLRIGWMITSPERIRSILALKRVMDLGCPPLMQAVALALLETGAYDEHLPKVRAAYRERRDVLLTALSRRMPEGVRWTEPQGGFHMWLELPDGYSGIALVLRAVDRGVAVLPGPGSDPDHRFVNAFRLCYAKPKPETIVEGIDLLADAVDDLLSDPPGDSGLSGLGDFF